MCKCYYFHDYHLYPQFLQTLSVLLVANPVNKEFLEIILDFLFDILYNKATINVRQKVGVICLQKWDDHFLIIQRVNE